jgi:hypothetical protein
MSTSVSNRFQQSFLVFLALVLTGCNYASQYEAELACEEWVKEGGTFTEYYKNPRYNPEPQEEDCTGISVVAQEDNLPTRGNQALVVDQKALCEVINQNIQEERDAGLYDERQYIDEKSDLHVCSLEKETQQYLGFSIESVQIQGKTTLLSNGKKIDPTGGIVYNKKVVSRFRY